MKPRISIFTSSRSQRFIARTIIIYSAISLAACDSGSHSDQALGFGVPSKISNVRALQYSDVYAEVSINESEVQTFEFIIDEPKAVPVTGIKLDEINTVTIEWFENFEGLPLILARQQGEFFASSDTRIADANFAMDENFDDDGDGFTNLDEREEGSCPRLICEPRTITFEAEDTLPQYMQTGQVHPNGMGLFATEDDPVNKYLAFGPYTKEFNNGPRSAEFFLHVDNVTADNEIIAKIDVHNIQTSRVLAERDLRRSDFTTPFQNSSFVLEFENPLDSELEFRVYYYGFSYLFYDKVIVK